MNPQPSQPTEADQERDTLLKEFRAYLHLVITAKQTGQEKQLAALPGPNLMSYCRALAELPDNTLAWELAVPITAILDQISKISRPCAGTLRRQDKESAARHAEARRILEQVDIALTLVARRFLHQLGFRSAVTQYSDLLCEVLHGMIIAYGMKPADLLRRYRKLTPQDGLDKDGSLTEGGFIESFARDT